MFFEGYNDHKLHSNNFTFITISWYLVIILWTWQQHRITIFCDITQLYVAHSKLTYVLLLEETYHNLRQCLSNASLETLIYVQSSARVRRYLRAVLYAMVVVSFDQYAVTLLMWPFCFIIMAWKNYCTSFLVTSYIYALLVCTY